MQTRRSKISLSLNFFRIAFVLSSIVFSPFSASAQDKVISRDEVMLAEQVAVAIAEEIDSVPMGYAKQLAFYENGGEALHARYSTGAIFKRLNEVRSSLGAVRQRRFAGYSGIFYAMPNIIPGEYLIINFTTNFSSSENKFDEEVTLEIDHAKGESWKFVDYYIAPK